MNTEYEIAIIGAGASGLMTASLLDKPNALILEGSAKAGAKLLISGGGKCNITNVQVEPNHYLGDHHFVRDVLRRFDQYDLLGWLADRGLRPVLRDEKHYFCAHSAKELLDVLKRESKDQKLILQSKVSRVSKKDGSFAIETGSGKFMAKNVVVASGGLSFPLLGADDIGYKIAESFGHQVHRTAPALVGFTVQKEQFFFKELSGISTEAVIKVGNHICDGALLFAHKGISGPAVLDASLYWEKGKIEIDFLPRWSFEEYRHSKKQISSLLPLPKRLIKAFLEHLGLADDAMCQLTKDQIMKLSTLKQYPLAPAGTFGYSKAEATKGGVATDEIDPKTMMSRLADGLYFVGEALDMTGRLGGYNLQWAFSTAYVCAKALNVKR